MKQADEAAFEAFVASAWPRLLKIAYLLTGDWGEAEDLVQTALAHCYRRWPRIVAGGAELPYVRKAIVNAHISNVRRRRIRELATFPLPDREQPGEAIGSADDRDLLRRALRRLPPRARAAVVLRHYADLSEEQAAEAMSCSTGNVKRLTADGLRLLRAYYDSIGVRPVPPAAVAEGRPR
jgi:RNA polymerase sigma-70 factor (sigma-E family)